MVVIWIDGGSYVLLLFNYLFVVFDLGFGWLS